MKTSPKRITILEHTGGYKYIQNTNRIYTNSGNKVSDLFYLNSSRGLNKITGTVEGIPYFWNEKGESLDKYETHLTLFEIPEVKKYRILVYKTKDGYLKTTDPIEEKEVTFDYGVYLPSNAKRIMETIEFELEI